PQVEADGPLDPQLVRHPPRRHNTTSGTRENRAHGLAGGARGRRDPAARLHDEDAPAAAGARDSRPGAQYRATEASEIRPKTRNQIGVDDYCGQALVFAELRKNLVGHGYRESKSSQSL